MHYRHTLSTTSYSTSEQPQQATELLYEKDTPSTPGTVATMRLRPRLRLRARAKDRSMNRKPLFLRCDPEQYSALLWPPAIV